MSAVEFQNAWVAALASYVETLGAVFAQTIEAFPFPIEIFDVTGLSVYVNQAMVDGLGRVLPCLEREQIVGRYNILKDAEVISSGRITDWLRVFGGESVHFPSVRQSITGIAGRYGLDLRDLDAVVYQDITAFPLFGEDGQIAYVVSVVFTRQVFRGKKEISQAVAHLEQHWREPFDSDALARVSGFSPSHFVRLFKSQTGVSPYYYYQAVRLKKLKEKLLDPHLTITQAFAACGMPYSGYASRRFKEQVGCTPSAFRKTG
jgi:AraC-like DNA-binding protein